MAIDYLAYQQNVKSPLEMAMAGYQSGLAIRSQRDKEAEAERQRAQAAAMQADLANLSANPTIDGYTSMMLKYPTLADNLKAPLAQLTEQQQSSKRQEALNVYAALDAGQTDIAESILERQYTAAQNAGDQAGIDSANSLLQLVRMNPEAAKTSAGLFLASTMGVEKFGDTMVKLQSEQRERALLPGELAKQGADLGLTRAQIAEVNAKTGKLGAESQKLALELQAMEEGTTPFDPEAAFRMENTLRGDYQKRTASLTEGTRNFDIIQTSANDKTGAGDIALVTSFMKMLDPGSVVRETEFASARDTGGLLASLQGYLTKLQGGEFLSEAQRKTFTSLARKYMEAAEREDSRVRTDLGFVIKNYNLNEQNIFGSRAGAEAPAAEQATGEQPSYMKYATGGGQ